jgi:electron transport complex protein RnfG
MAEISVARSATTLASIAALCTALVAFTHQLTDERIARNEQAWLEQSLQPALSGVLHDGNIIETRATMSSPHGLPGSQDALVYRAYAAGEPVAALFVVHARDGYSGPIRLLIGIRTDGRLTGVHVLEHRETPGLGDLVESTKTDWAQQFPGRSIGDPVAAGWAIRRDGGDFDQLTGASVTPRAIVKAVYETLDYFAENRETLFALPADTSLEASQ